MSEPSSPEPLPRERVARTETGSSILSVVSLVAGVFGLLLGFTGFGLIFAAGAVVLGHLGQRKESQARGLWLSGLIAGYVGIVLNVIAIVFALIALGSLIGTGTYYSPR